MSLSDTLCQNSPLLQYKGLASGFTNQRWLIQNVKSHNRHIQNFYGKDLRLFEQSMICFIRREVWWGNQIQPNHWATLNVYKTQLNSQR